MPFDPGGEFAMIGGGDRMKTEAEVLAELARARDEAERNPQSAGVEAALLWVLDEGPSPVLDEEQAPEGPHSRYGDGFQG
jgi:hypothetical protein